MKALVKTSKGKGFLEIREVPVPQPGKGEVLIKVKATGICGSDVHIYHDEHPYYPPVVIGHEFSGEIVKVGEEVHGWRAGDRVVAELHTNVCGTCRYCKTGNSQICLAKRPPGWGIDGAFAEYIKIPYNLLHRIPDNVAYEEATLTEPTAIAVHGVLEKTTIEPEDTVVVLGAGPIGILSAQVARAACAAKVIVTGTTRRSSIRLDVARSLNFDEVLDTDYDNLEELVQRITGGNGPDVFIDACGAESAINQAVQLVRRGGRICGLGISGRQNIAFPWDKAIFKDCQVVFSFSSNYMSWERALSMISRGKVQVGPLISHCLPLDAWEEGFAAIESGQAVKVLLLPNQR
ncbi:MAG: zinc-dependent alcohol dehydrogenase [Eubacteriales bacterium]